MGHTPVKVMISSIRMQINGFPEKSFARTFSTVPRKITSGTEFRISVFPATRFVDPRFRKTRTTLSSLSLPSSSPDFSRRISYKKKKKRSSMFSPLSLNGAQISNNRRNGIGNCSSIFLFLFCFFPSRVEFRIDRIRHVFPHRPFPLSIKRNRVRARETTRDFHPFLYYRLLICPINKSNAVK